MYAQLYNVNMACHTSQSIMCAKSDMFDMSCTVIIHVRAGVVSAAQLVQVLEEAHRVAQGIEQ